MQPEKFGSYELLDKVATGGMGEVFLASQGADSGFERHMAIKRMLPDLSQDDELVDMFLDEARLASQLNHQNIVQIYDLGVCGSQYYLAMEFLEGRDLRRIMARLGKRRKAMPAAFAMQIVYEAAEGLHYAHELCDQEGTPLNIIHRDVSPQNIFVTFHGTIKVLDFGIAKAGTQMSRTRTGFMKGKVAYTSPEQVAGHKPDRRCDIFSLGTLLWEITTGKRLFRRENDLLSLKAVVECDVPRPTELYPNYPPALEKIVLRALAANPDERYQTCCELQEEMLQFMASYGHVVTPQRLGDWARELFHDEARTVQELLEQLKQEPEMISLLGREVPRNGNEPGSASRPGISEPGGPFEPSVVALGWDEVELVDDDETAANIDHSDPSLRAEGSPKDGTPSAGSRPVPPPWKPPPPTREPSSEPDSGQWEGLSAPKTTPSAPFNLATIDIPPPEAFGLPPPSALGSQGEATVTKEPAEAVALPGSEATPPLIPSLAPPATSPEPELPVPDGPEAFPESTEASSSSYWATVIGKTRHRMALSIVIVAGVMTVLGGTIVGVVLGFGGEDEEAPPAGDRAVATVVGATELDPEPNDGAPSEVSSLTAAPSVDAADASTPEASTTTGDAEPPAPAMAGLLEVEIATAPSKLEVFLGEKAVGTSPVTIRAKEGAQDVRVRSKAQGIDYTTTLEVTPGNRQLTINVPRGILALRVRPYADVFINGRRVGLTPIAPIKLYAGRHRVKLVNTSLKKTVSRAVTIRPGQRATLRVDLMR